MNSDNQTRAFLLAHCQAYPRLELTDLFKALYQSAYGCEHLVGDASAAAAYIIGIAVWALSLGISKKIFEKKDLL